MVSTTRSKTAAIAGFPDTGSSQRSTARFLNPDTRARKKAQTTTEKLGRPIPIYQIDLSAPPRERYVALARAYRGEIATLPQLFDYIVSNAGQRPALAHRWARALLHGLHDKVQTEELRGISGVTGVPMYLLVCFNTLLDLFMGCSSGGMRTHSAGADGYERMLHYRTLDWGMDALRKTVVQLEYVERPGGPVVARTITYVGFLGVLTGVRRRLSLSLNFRPRHNDNSRLGNVRFYGHLLLVLLGWRPSIASKLRDLIIPGRRSVPDFEHLMRTFPNEKTTAAYLILSNGNSTAVLEKDLASAKILQSDTFISCTNHDSADETSTQEVPSSYLQGQRAKVVGEQFLLESVDRKQCMSKLWQRHLQKQRMRTADGYGEEARVTHEDLSKWLQMWPITNESTHYACVMDPTTGAMIWSRKWDNPLLDPED